MDRGTGYRLGAVGTRTRSRRKDRAGGRRSIAPGQDKTFSFTMIAPSAGVYTTDWRMVREGVQWFGDTLTKQVNVTFGPNPPGAPTIAWPTTGMVLARTGPTSGSRAIRATATKSTSARTTPPRPTTAGTQGSSA